MVNLKKCALALVIFCVLTYVYWQLILILSLIPLYFIFEDVSINQYILYGIIGAIAIGVSLLTTKRIVSKKYEPKI